MKVYVVLYNSSNNEHEEELFKGVYGSLEEVMKNERGDEELYERSGYWRLSDEIKDDLNEGCESEEEFYERLEEEEWRELGDWWYVRIEEKDI